MQAEIETRQAAIEKIIDSAPEKGAWSDARIAERTRLLNTLKRLEELRTTSAKELPAKLAQEEAVRRIADRAARRAGRAFPLACTVCPSLAADDALHTLVLICMFVLVATVLKSISRFGTRSWCREIGNQVSLDLRNMFFRQVLRLDMAHFTEQGRGDLMNRCTADLGSVGQGVQRVFGQALLEPLKMVACLSIAAYVSWQLLLITIIIAPIAGYTIHWLGKALKRTHKQAMQELSSIFETLGETLGGIKLIKGFTMEPGEQREVSRVVEEALPPANEDRHLQLAGEPAHRDAGSRHGD